MLSVTVENGADLVLLPGTTAAFKTFSRDATNASTLVSPAAMPPRYSSGVSVTATTLLGGGMSKHWSYKTGAITLAAPGLDPGNLIALGAADGKFHSMKPQTGERRFQPGNDAGLPGYVGSSVQSSPSVINAEDSTGVDCNASLSGNQPCTIAFIGAEDGRVYAFNADTGERIWASPLLALDGGSIQGSPAVRLKAYANARFAAPVDLIFVGTRNIGDHSRFNNRVYALSARDGSIVWTFNESGAARMDIISSTPAVDYAENAVYVTSRSNDGRQNSLWKSDSNTGHLLDAFRLGDIDGSPTLSYSGKMVFAVTNTGDLAAARTDLARCSLQASSGDASGRGFPIPYPASDGTEHVYFSTQNSLHKFQVRFSPSALACGTEVLTNLNGAGWTSPEIANASTPIANIAAATKYLYVGDSMGESIRFTRQQVPLCSELMSWPDLSLAARALIWLWAGFMLATRLGVFMPSACSSFQ
jgi:outer membrane protein assembly factor BamB